MTEVAVVGFAQSPCGVRDLSGSAFEWLDQWFDEPRGLRRLAGGSWARTEPLFFGTFGGIGGKEDETREDSGFRLVWRPVNKRGPRKDAK